MANLRIIYNNVADLATISASTTASGSASNMQNTQKTSAHRSSSTSTVTYTLTWSTAQNINCIALPATNLIAGDLITVKLYTTATSDAAGAVAQAIDQSACTGRIMLLQNGSTTSTLADFGYGGATKTSIWFSNSYSVQAMEITLTRGSGLVQQIDCARIVCGQYWETSRQVTKGIDVGTEDQSEIITTRSGNTYVDKKTISDTLSFNLDYINDVDRKTFLQLLRSWGKTGLIYVCVFPDNANTEYTQAYSIYGRLQNTSLRYEYLGYYNTSIQLISW
jgi:hypothetical protein